MRRSDAHAAGFAACVIFMLISCRNPILNMKLRGFVQSLPSGFMILIMGVIVLTIIALLAAKFIGYI